MSVEFFSLIKILKVNMWEECFIQNLKNLRSDEILLLYYIGIFFSSFFIFFIHSGILKASLYFLLLGATTIMITFTYFVFGLVKPGENTLVLTFTLVAFMQLLAKAIYN